MTSIRVTESRRYDSRYDPTFTGPFNNVASDPRVVAAASSQNVVSGQTRYKFFKRPVMPRMNAVPPYILLAPAGVQETLQPIEFVSEPPAKDVEVQTMYRESEAQTLPYTPDFIIPDGSDPEVLLLKNFTYGSGLPLGKKEMEVLMQARSKKEVETRLPPFTDEASMNLRRKLMEQQDTREFKLRENEIDEKREIRLEELQQALYERDESNEFLASQRVEAMRLSLMEEREKTLQKIRNKRIKVLRRLARQRNLADPLLTNGGKRDIITEYFDKSSAVYAPVKREGRNVKQEHSNFDVMSRTAPLDSISNIVNLEPSIPKSLSQTQAPGAISPSKMISLSATTGGGGRAAEERMTSAAQRIQRNTKRDVEEMHQILMKKKRSAIVARANATAAAAAERTADYAGTMAATTSAAAGLTGTAANTAGQTLGGGTGLFNATNNDMTSFLLSKKPKGRPTTPDLTVDANGEPLGEENEVTASVVLLQRLLRGRAVQNVMYEGRFRRRELIAELRASEEMTDFSGQVRVDSVQREVNRKQAREKAVRETTLDAVAGTVTSHMFLNLTLEQERMDAIAELEALAIEYVEERRRLEAVEAGRRQKAGDEPSSSPAGGKSSKNTKSSQKMSAKASSKTAASNNNGSGSPSEEGANRIAEDEESASAGAADQS